MLFKFLHLLLRSFLPLPLSVLPLPSSSSSVISFYLFIHFLSLILPKHGNACAATTNNPPNMCASCTSNQLTLTPGDGTTSTTPTVSGITIDANGCAHITVTCTAINGGMTFMQFNVNQGGPINPTGTVVMATLDCINGQWVYQQGGISRVITEVNCQNT